MGIIKSSFTFLAGTGLGLYLAQNYNVPNIKKLARTVKCIVIAAEQTYRKPETKDDDE